MPHHNDKDTNINDKAKPFGVPQRAMSFLRGQTPAKQKDMKKQLNDLLMDLQAIEDSLNQEQKIKSYNQDEASHHEATAAALDLQLRVHQRADIGLDQQLKAILLADNDTSQATALKVSYRTQTPARQREIKQQITSYVQDLDKLQNQAKLDHAARLRLHREVIKETKPMNSIAFSG